MIETWKAQTRESKNGLRHSNSDFRPLKADRRKCACIMCKLVKLKEEKKKSINATRDDQSLVSPRTLITSFDILLYIPT